MASKKDKEERNLLLGIIASVLAVGGGVYWYRRKNQPETYGAGDTARVVQGQQILLRLPRGEYSMAGDDGLVQIMAQRSKGDHTDLSLQIMSDIASFELSLLFVDEGDTENRFELKVHALLPKEF